MKKKRGESEGERRTKWLLLDVGTKKKNEQITFRR